MPTNWDQQSLDDLRLVMDPDADNAINSIYQSRSNAMLRNTLTEIASNDSMALKEYFASIDAPEPLYDLINNELSQEFTDEDIAMFQRTHEIWLENGVQFVYILFFRALPFTYAAEKPANVLRMTKLIEDQATRRIFETAQFVFDVMDENWWEPDKRGIITAVKIRLMHAAMRYMLLHDEDGTKWDTTWGMPISQEDMIATNQVFSLEFFKGMAMLGDPLPQADQDAWFHTWKVIARIMGIQDDLLLPTIPEAWDLQTKIYQHLFIGEHSSGIGLAKALVEALGQFMLPTKLVLLIMQRMMKDDAFPDVFNQLLGPSYGDDYGSIFTKTRGMDDGTLDEQLRDDFFDELKNFQGAVQDYRQKELADKPATRGEADKNLVDFQLDEFDKIFGEVEKTRANGPAKKEGFLEKEVDKAKEEIVGELTEIIDDAEKDEKERGLKEDINKIKDEIMKKAMNAIGAVIIDVLSKYFRPGKRAGFRIDANLKEHWKLG